MPATILQWSNIRKLSFGAISQPLPTAAQNPSNAFGIESLFKTNSFIGMRFVLFRNAAIRSVCLSVMLLASVGTLHAQWRLKMLSWNIESADADLSWVTEQLSTLEGFDILALSEVNPEWAEALVSAAEDGEGAKGNWEAEFNYALSETGYSQRLMLIWDNLRFERVGDPVELHSLNTENLTYRSPLYLQLRNRTTGSEFIVMVNHLARGAEDIRDMQAQGLVDWVQTQTIPVVALGDYNFDYDIDEGVGNNGFDLMTATEDWIWVRPDRLMKSQAAFSYNSILDFVFVANAPETWSGFSDILSLYTPFEDDEITVDHRPVAATFYIFPEEENQEPDPEAAE